MVCKTPQTLGSKLLGQYEQRGTYRNQKEAFLAFLGYSVGLGNFWRFPFLCAKYNGVTFLIPYFVALVTMGLPLYFLEMALSQYVSIGPTRLFSFICPVFCGVGWAMVLVMMLETIYYNIGIAWTLFYAVASMQWNLPWCVSPALNATDCSQVENHYKAAALYFNQTVLGEAQHGGDGMHWWLLLSLGAAWCLLAAVIARGISSLAKVLYITVGVAYIILPSLLVASYASTDSTKWQAFVGKILYVDADTLWSGLIWSEAATQVMYSLGLAHAGIHTLASYNTFRHNILRDAILLVLVDTVTSILCTLVVFSSLATIAEDLPTEEQELTKLVFVVFPGLLSKIDTHPWPIIVFCMIFFFGFNSQFAMVETITTAFFDQFHALRRCYVPVVVATCAVLFTTGIPMCMRGGITFFQFLDKNITAHSFLFLGLSEVFIVSYAYGFENFMSIIRDRMKVSVFKPFYWYFKVMYTVVTPFFMLVCLAHSLHKRDWSRDAWGVTGIAFALFPFVVVGVGAVCALCRNRSMGLASLLRPTSDFCPEYERRERAASPQTFELQASATPRLPRGG